MTSGEAGAVADQHRLQNCFSGDQERIIVVPPNDGSGQRRVTEPWQLGVVVTGCSLSGAPSHRSIDQRARSLHPPRKLCWITGFARRDGENIWDVDMTAENP